jgi:CP family cyanate transporter-like MFS transporter
MSKLETRQAVLAFIGLILVALNLRPALSSIGPMLRTIGDSFTLSSTALGILTTLPVLFLGLAAPLAPKLASRLGVEKTVLAVLAVLALALLVRPYSGLTGLFTGTAIAGGCIGIIGVLLPGIVKRDFPNHASLMTGIYTAALCSGAAVAAGTTEPLREMFDQQWRPALAFWLMPAVIAFAAWWFQLSDKKLSVKPGKPRGKSIYRDRLAWQIALYMGLQSSLAYAVFGWLPTILQDRGISAVEAGLALSVSILVQVVSAIAAPLVASQMRDQRAMICLVMLLVVAGLAGCIYGPMDQMWLWVVLLGLGQGGSFSLALTLLVVRARDAEGAGRLSGMAQSLGYTMAAFGPLLVGVLHDLFGGWQAAGGFLIAIGLGAALAGLNAGRDAYVLDD